MAEAERPSPEEDPDALLLVEVGRGSDEALNALVQRWKNPLINFFYRSLRSYEHSEDLAQMVFIRLYRAAPNYEPRAKFTTYMFQIARRLLINEYRRQQRKPLDFVDPADLRPQAQSAHEYERFEIEEAFEKALAELPENQRTALLLLKQQGLSYQEIADSMNATESAVKTWIHRGRQFLKQQLKDLV